MITKHELNILARFEIGNALDKLFAVLSNDIFFPSIYRGFSGVVGGNRFKPVVRIAPQ